MLRNLLGRAQRVEPPRAAFDDVVFNLSRWIAARATLVAGVDHDAMVADVGGVGGAVLILGESGHNLPASEMRVNPRPSLHRHAGIARATP